MDDPCPICGLVFEREPGYFLAAMYFSYALAVACMVPIFLVLWSIFPDAPILLLPMFTCLLYLPLAPIVFRYSRALWLYVDRWSSPGEFSSPQAWTDWKSSELASKER